MIKLEEGEKLIKIVRRHYFVVLPMVFTIALGVVLPVLVYLFLTSDLVNLGPNMATTMKTFVSNWGVFIYSLWALILWIVLFIEWTDYYLDIWILTDKRIIDVEQIGFFHREVTSFAYSQIQDITVETRGILETFLKFGTLHIQTAGHNRNIIINDAHNPEEARALILNLQEGASAS